MRLLPVKPFSESRCDPARAAIALAGVPLDATVSCRPGTRLAPAAIRETSWHQEDWSPAERRSILDVPFRDAGDLHLTGDLPNNLKEIAALVLHLTRGGTKALLLGGEHLLTFPAVAAAVQRWRELRLVVFDAHADLSDSYRGMDLSHAATVRLAHGVLGDGRVVMLGPRAGTREDFAFMRGRIPLSTGRPGRAFLEPLAGKPLWVSVDVDVLDPSAAPGVTTPELGGWTWEALEGTLAELGRLGDIVGADIVEICPPFDPSGVTSLVGAGLARKLLFLMSGRRTTRRGSSTTVARQRTRSAPKQSTTTSTSTLKRKKR